MGSVLPLRRLIGLLVDPRRQELEVAARNQRLQQLGSCCHLRRGCAARPLSEQGGRPPRTFSPPAAPGLLDQAVLRQLAEVERRQGVAYPEKLGCLGRRKRPFSAEQADESKPKRMGEPAQGSRIGELDGAARFRSHVPRIALEALLWKLFFG